MTDYTELVKALRGLANGIWKNSEYTWFGGEEKVFADAAAAIEALQEQVRMLDKHDTDLHNEGFDVGYYAGRRDWEPKRGEIVRCKECKWYSIYEAKKDGTPDKRYSPSVCLREIYAKRRDPDWYCADGEREVQE